MIPVLVRPVISQLLSLYFELGKVSERLQMIQPRSDALNEIQELLDRIGRKLIGIDSLPPQHDQ
ncbi:hypothetical protein IQ238_28625 [Pleurocapsales cyanobacterium LEGE 06147]|nr:hypothetical protein [Pleurocapsales cyanobacterium LEGE 06147]